MDFTKQTQVDDRLLPNFHYDDIFGTVINRFICQAVAGIPLTIFGKGGQTRGYLNINDTMQCIDLAAQSPVEPGNLRILNQFTELLSVNQIAEKVSQAANLEGYEVKIESVPNPRVEMEDHYYNAKHSGLTELGLQPNFLTTDTLRSLIRKVGERSDEISIERALPRISWNSKT